MDTLVSEQRETPSGNMQHLDGSCLEKNGVTDQGWEIFGAETSEPTAPDPILPEKKTRERKPELSSMGKVVVVIACATVNFIIVGFSLGFGVIFVEILKVFQTSRALTSLMQTMCMGIIYIGALFISPIVQKLTPGPSIILGGLLSMIGLLVAGFVHNVPALIVTVGLITGTGFSFAFLASYVTVSAVMVKKGGLGISVITAGAGLGSFLSPQLKTVVLEYYSWRGTFMILSAISFHLCAIGFLIHVLTKPIFKKLKKENPDGTKSCMESLNVFKNVSYLMLFLFQLPLWTFITGQMVFIVDMAETRGFARQQSSFLLSALAIAYIPGSLIAGLLTSLCRVPALSVLYVSLFFIAIISLAWTYFTSYALLVTLAAVTGLFISAADAAVPVALIDMVSVDVYPSALAYVFGISGFSELCSGPASGAIRDITGNYNYMFYLSSATSGIIGAIYMGLHVYELRMKKYKLELRNTTTDIRL